MSIWFDDINSLFSWEIISPADLQEGTSMPLQVNKSAMHRYGDYFGVDSEENFT